jgi:DNA-binding response OmpR family regulator
MAKEGTVMAKKILVIEDDPAISRLVDYSLRHEGYEVIAATNGLEGIRKAQNEAPDLIILDVMLPGMDGFEICHRMRSESDTAQLPILMFSAKAQEIDKETGLKVGADDYLPKPAAPAEIVNRVGKLLADKGKSAKGREKVSGQR